MQIDRFYKNSFIITTANLLTGIAAFIFSIILSRELGTEGLGLYGLIMPIYILLICLTSEGLVTAISKIAAVYANRQDYRNLHKTIETLLVLTAGWALVITLFVIINSTEISFKVIKDFRSSNALKILCPAVLFVTGSAVLKGYFYGIGQFKIPAAIDIIEKTLRIIILTKTIAVLSLNGIADTVTAAYFALTVGELISFIALYGFYKAHRQKFNGGAGRPENRLQLLIDVLVISIPLALIGVFSASFSVITALILPQRLMSAGFSYPAALSLIGEFNRMALYITTFPIIIVISISAVLIPDLSTSLSRHNYWAVENRVIQVFKISLLCGLITLTVCQLIPGELGALIFNRPDLGPMIKFASWVTLPGWLSGPTFGIMNGLGRQKVLLRNSLIVSGQELILIYFLAGVPAINIYGVGLTQAVTSVTTLLLNFYEINKVLDLPRPLAKIIFLWHKS